MKKQRLSPEWAKDRFFLLHLAATAPEIQQQIGVRPPTELTEEQKRRPKCPYVQRKKTRLTLWKHAKAGEFSEV